MQTAEFRHEPSDFRLFLQQELLRRCRKNPHFSMRAFAKLLRTDASNLNKILRGERKLGPNVVEKFSERLGLTPSQTEKFLTERTTQRKRAKAAKSGKTDEVGPDYQQLTLDSFQVISDWYHYAILELMRLDHFVPTPKWIAQTLGITTGEVRIALERLERIGILEIISEGKWIDHSEGRSTTIGNRFSAVAFRNLQRQVLERAIQALEEIPMEERDQSSMTMAIDSEKLPEAKETIRAFRRQMATLLSRGERRDEVYNLSVSLYPLTRIHQKKAEGERK